MKRGVLFFMGLLLLAGSSWAQGPKEWDLKRCLDLGLARNPRLTAGSKAVEGAEARVRQNQADYYPNLFLETDVSRFKGGFSGSSQNSDTSDSNLYSYYLGLSQNIYDFGRRESKVQSSREDLKAYAWDLKDVRLLVMDDIRQAYYGVLLADRIVKVREEDLERTRAALRQAQGFYQVGLKARIDVTQAEVEVIKAQKALLSAGNDAQLNRVLLEKAMGLERPREKEGYRLKDDLESGQVGWNLDDLRQEALEKQPSLNRLQAVVKFWEAQEKLAERDFWPRLTGTAKYGYANLDDIGLTDNNWVLGIQLNIPLFSGFLTQSRLAEVRAALGQAKANEQTRKQELLAELEGYYLNLILAEKQIEVTQESLRKAGENLDLASGRYKAGVGTMLEVTDARVSLSQAETDYVQSLFDYKKARFKIERSLGRENS